MATNMDVLNLSIGGPDYLDLPFVEKVIILKFINSKYLFVCQCGCVCVCDNLFNRSLNILS